MEHRSTSRRAQHKLLFALAFMALCFALPIRAYGQSSRLAQSATFTTNIEELHYKISFKWGILTGKIGEASVVTRTAGSGQYFSKLTMRTTGLADKFYAMRDTLETLYSAKKLPMRFEKRIDDNGFISSDIGTFVYSPAQTKVVNKQSIGGEEVLDTTLVYKQSERVIVDLLSTIALVRTYDYVNVEEVKPMKVIVPLADKSVYLEYLFKGTEQIEMPDGTQRQAMKVVLNVNDKNFSTSKNSMVVWLTRDKEQVPVKIRADLAVGAAVVDLVRSYRK